ncbi:MAG: hypothetical protein EXS14_08610 [Planctomycetes bacterium]|nr:hypothetical protein [Planctomycetota bacterium]
MSSLAILSSASGQRSMSQNNRRVSFSILFLMMLAPLAAQSVRPVYPGAGSAAHKWIDIVAGNDANAGTAAAPWRTLDKMESVTLLPGTIVHVKTGTYMLNGNLVLNGKNGTVAAWIGIEAEGTVLVRNTALQNVVELSACSYLYLRGFDISHENGSGAYGTWAAVDAIKFTGNCNDVSIDSCVLHDVGNCGVSSQANLVQRITVYGCEIRHCYCGIYWGYYESTAKRYAHDGRIASNYIHDCPPVDLDGTGYGLQIKGGSYGNVIEDNVLVNVGGNTRAGICVYHASTSTAVSTQPNIIRRNLVRNARNEGIYASEGALIENNVLSDSQNCGIRVTRRDTVSWGAFYGRLTIRNNTIQRVMSATGVGLSVQTNTFSAPFIVANNFSCVNGAATQKAFEGPIGFSGTASKNYCYGTVTGTNLGSMAANATNFWSHTFGNAGYVYPKTTSVFLNQADLGNLAADDFNGMARSGASEPGAYHFTLITNPGWTPTANFKNWGSLSFTLSVSGAIQPTGGVVLVSANLSNAGRPQNANVVLGIVLPDAQSAFQFADPYFLSMNATLDQACMTWSVCAPNLSLSTPFSLNLTNVIGWQWLPLHPHGNYTIKALLVAPGSLADNSLDEHDVLASSSAIVTHL